MGLKSLKSSVVRAGGSRGKTVSLPFPASRSCPYCFAQGPASNHNTLTTASVITSPSDSESPASFIHL